MITFQELAFTMFILDAATLAASEQRQAHQRQVSVGKRGYGILEGRSRVRASVRRGENGASGDAVAVKL